MSLTDIDEECETSFNSKQKKSSLALNQNRKKGSFWDGASTDFINVDLFRRPFFQSKNLVQEFFLALSF